MWYVRYINTHSSIQVPFNCCVYHCYLKNEVWKMEIHKLYQIDGRNHVSVQIYSFLKVAAVRYDKKTRQRWTKMWFLWYRDKKEWIVLDSSTESTSQQHNRLHDTCSQNMSDLLPCKSILTVLRDVIKTFNYLFSRSLLEWRGIQQLSPNL